MEVWADEERDRVFVFCRGVAGASILRATLAEVTLRLVVPGEIDRVDLLDDAFATLPGMIVREERLEDFVPKVDDVLVWTEGARVFEVLLATSTVRLTGRDRVALLGVERLETARDGADLEGVVADDLLDREFEDCDARGAVAGVDRLF